MIRFPDSCSWCTINAIGVNGPGIKYNHISGSGAGIGSGRYGGGAYTFTNSIGQVVFQRVLDAQQYWYDSRNMLVINARLPETLIWTWLAGSTVVAGLTLGSDGKLRIYQGGDGNTNFGGLLYQSNAVLAINTFYSIDLAWFFPGVPGAHGSVSLYVNDVLDTAHAGNPSVPSVLWAGQPDRFNECWGNNSGSGYQFSDLVVSDGQGAANNSRLGPCQVKMYLPGTDQLAQFTRFPAANPSDASCINEVPGHTSSGQAPDGDLSYITSTASGKRDLFTFGYYSGGTFVPGLDCYASIFGLAISVCCRDSFASPLTIQVIPNPSLGVAYTVGSPQMANQYGVVQAISEVNPATGAQWTDGDIANAWWGVVQSGGAPVITQLILEKVTTTRGVPYGCGGIGSYQY